jgi:acetate kinase
VGFNVPQVRSAALSGLAGLGIEIDEQLNHAPSDRARAVSTETSTVQILVIPTNEEWEIARQALAAARATPST